MLKILFNKIANFIRPSLVISGMGDIIDIWRGADAKDRGIFVLTFAPMFACVGGLLFSLIRFILFVLPSFVLGFLGWGLLITIFAWGGRYCYEKFTGNKTASSGSSYNSHSETVNAEYIDVKFTEDK